MRGNFWERGKFPKGSLGLKLNKEWRKESDRIHCRNFVHSRVSERVRQGIGKCRNKNINWDV